MLVVLVGAAVLIAAFNVLEAAGDPTYQRAVAQTRVDSERAVELADAGIPPALSLRPAPSRRPCPVTLDLR